MASWKPPLQLDLHQIASLSFSSDQSRAQRKSLVHSVAMQHDQLSDTRVFVLPLKTHLILQGVTSNLRIMLLIGAEVEGTPAATKLAELLHVYLQARSAAKRLIRAKRSRWLSNISQMICPVVIRG